MTLQQLAEKYGTDKLEHGYLPFYEKHLPKNPKRILEIGVKEGKSLAMWGDYFPEAHIIGLDLFEEYSHETVFKNIDDFSNGECDISKINLATGNQCDWRVLEELRKYDFDVIIDDGSHNARDQMITFFGLFNGKHYFIEDLHCCREEFYRQGLPYVMSADYLFGSTLPQKSGHVQYIKGNNIVLIKSDISVAI